MKSLGQSSQNRFVCCATLYFPQTSKCEHTLQLGERAAANARRRTVLELYLRSQDRAAQEIAN